MGLFHGPRVAVGWRRPARWHTPRRPRSRSVRRRPRGRRWPPPGRGRRRGRAGWGCRRRAPHRPVHRPCTDLGFGTGARGGRGSAPGCGPATGPAAWPARSRPPRVDVVEAAHHVADRPAVGPRAHADAPGGACISWSNLSRVAFGLPAEKAQRAVVVAPHRVEELVQGRGRAAVRAHAQERAGSRGSLVRGVVRPGLRVDVAVEDHGADLVGEEIGVGGAQERAVGDPEVVELRVAHRLAELVEVAGGVGGRHMAQELGVTLLAAPAEIAVRGDPGRPLPVAHREPAGLPHLQARGFLGAVEAVHRGAVTDPARVPADDVEPLPHLAREGLVVLRHLHRPGPAGSAGVEEQGADAPSGAGRLPPDDCQLDGAAARDRCSPAAPSRSRSRTRYPRGKDSSPAAGR